MTDLHQLLREATDHVGSPDLAGRALVSAHRTRVRRAAASALAAVVLLGGGVAWAVQDRVPHADVVDTPAPTPSPSVTPSVVDDDPATQRITMVSCAPWGRCRPCASATGKTPASVTTSRRVTGRASASRTRGRGTTTSRWSWNPVARSTSAPLATKRPC